MTDHLRFYRGRRVLITGGLGFIGSNLARAARRARRRRPDRRLADPRLRRQPLQHRRHRRPRPRQHRRRPRRDARWTSSSRDREIIFNLAGQVSHIDSMRDPHTDLEINCRAQLSMLEACRKHNPGVRRRLRRHAAGLRPARSAAGRRDAPRPPDRRQRRQQGGRRVLPPALQQRLRRPRLLAAADQRLRAAPADPAQPPGLHRLVHPPGDRGPGDPDLRRRLAAARLRLRRRCGGRVPARRRAATPATATCSTSAATSRSATAISSTCCSRSPAPGRVTYVEWPPEKKRIDIGSFYSDSSKFRGAVGWTPTVDLREGFERTIAFYRAASAITTSTRRRPRPRARRRDPVPAADARRGPRGGARARSTASSRAAGSSSDPSSRRSSGSSPRPAAPRTPSASAPAPTRSRSRCARSASVPATKSSPRRCRPPTPRWRS